MFVRNAQLETGFAELHAEPPRGKAQAVLPGFRQQLFELVYPPAEKFTYGPVPDSRLPVLDFIFYRYSHMGISGGILHANA